MIDTVILEIPQGLYLVDDIEKAKWSLAKRYGSYSVRVRHFPKDDIYRPRISFIHNGFSQNLRIEFSIPKLLYGVNLQEVSGADFEAIIDKLQKIIRIEYGIEVFRDNLERAKVMAFHPSKNILFTNSYRAKHIIKLISKANFPLKLDKTKTDFRNDGESLQIHSKAHSLVVYDKICDLHKPKKRAIDKDQTNIQKLLSNSIKMNKRNQEIVRIEVRISQKRKMNEMLEKLGHSKDLVFQDLFKSNICQEIVIWYWNNWIMKGNKMLFISKDTPQDILKQVMSSTEVKPKEVVTLVGIIVLMKDGGGVRDLKSMLAPYYGKDYWYRLIKRAEEVSDTMIDSPYPPWIKEIEKQLKEFIPLDIDENEQGLQIRNKELTCKQK